MAHEWKCSAITVLSGSVRNTNLLTFFSEVYLTFGNGITKYDAKYVLFLSVLYQTACQLP